MLNFEELDFTEGLKHGNSGFFKLLFEEFYPSLCLFAERHVKDQDVAGDIVQDTFLKYWERRADFENLYKIKSFLYIVVRNACFNWMKTNRLRSGIIDEYTDTVNISEAIIEEEAFRIFHNTIKELPTQMRNVIHYSLQGLKNSEIASEMQISENSVHAYKKEAYKKLRIMLKEHYYLVEVFFFLLLN